MNNAAKNFDVLATGLRVLQLFRWCNKIIFSSASS